MNRVNVNECPSQEELRNRIAGTLSNDERNRIGVHLVGCRNCQNVNRELLIARNSSTPEDERTRAS